MKSSRSTLFALSAILIAAFLLRAWNPDRMSIEHFDEGVYASNLFSDHLDFRYPDRQFYAPPLLPAMLEWVLIVSGAQPHAVMWLNVVLGTALVWAVWWTTRELLRESRVESRESSDTELQQPPVSTVTESAALAAAAIVAFSDIFIQYSRAALTDVPVCLWITLAVGAGTKAFRTGSWFWIGASSILTALAWWTKYNGWLPLAILGAGLAGWMLFTREGRASWNVPVVKVSKKKSKSKSKQTSDEVPVRPGFSLTVRFGLIALAAILLWLPYLWDLQDRGGYAAVAANHRGYLVGWTGWGGSVVRHFQVDHYYSRWPSALGVVIAVLVTWGPLSRCGLPASTIAGKLLTGAIAVIVLLLAGMVALAGLIPCLLLLTVVGVVARCQLLKARWRPCRGEWILLAWFLGLALTTPLYRPYPRLILPWMISLSIFAGWGLMLLREVFQDWLRAGQSAREDGTTPESVEEIPHWGMVARFLAVGLLFAGGVGMSYVVVPVWLHDRRGLETVASEVISAIQSDLREGKRSSVPELDCVIYVLAEPGLYYHLAAHEDETLKYITQPASNLGMLEPGKVDDRVPTYVITGPHAKAETEELAGKAGQVQPTERFGYRASDLVLLDDSSPKEVLLREKNRQEEPIWLWRLQSR